jgi:predicted N-acetyltransferase YhbS
MKNLIVMSLLAFALHLPAENVSLPRSTPEEQGISSAAILDFVEAADKNFMADSNAVHSFMLVRHGYVVAEGWWSPYDAAARHKMFSLSKSFNCTAVGLAIAEGKLSLNDISDGTPNWYGLGPVSVLPEHQRMGIGKALIKEGLSRLKDRNAQGCCLVGHPDYYKKLGFKNVSGLVHDGVPSEVFFALSFDGHAPHGTVVFHEAFKADGQQITGI